jgi:3-hydroxybutyryl-CoA dehydrogenase
MSQIGIIGSGVMGAGIAQVAASHGCTVVLTDVSQPVVEKAIDGIGQQLGRSVEKGKISAADRAGILGRIRPGSDPSALADCDIIIEAVAESLDVKTQVFRALGSLVRADTILASNTSSLPITQIGRAAGQSLRLVGMHFFNPVPVMPLVEVVAGEDSISHVVDRVADLARSWGKTVVRAKDTPGFIVNRVARGYYLESLRLLEEGVAGLEEIDKTMRDLGGFRMGPFELMDLVGIDVNYNVSESVWRQLGKPLRLQPHPIQAELLQKGHLGRKTKVGFYSYDSDPPRTVLLLPMKPQAAHVDTIVSEFRPSLSDAVTAFAKGAAKSIGTSVQNLIFSRVLIALINEAGLALAEGVATKEDIDTAMRLGTNYPHGPLEWADRIGIESCKDLLLALAREPDRGRWRPAPMFQTVKG